MPVALAPSFAFLLQYASLVRFFLTGPARNNMLAPFEEKMCFVIAPIGLEGTDIRKRSDRVFKHIIDPVVRAQGYQAIRADHISTPGVITSQIIDHVLNAHLVVADLQAIIQMSSTSLLYAT